MQPISQAPTTWTETVNGIQIQVLRWGDEPTPGQRNPKPAAILVCGTGFPGLTWRNVAEMLAEDYVVYSFDRRGHGSSEKPPAVEPNSGRPPGWGYDFTDFTDDLLGLIDALQLPQRRGELYGIGHSAGGTDVLVAAGRRHDLFSRVFVHEPTVAHPCVEEPGPPPPEFRDSQRDGPATNRRRVEFESAAAVFARYGARPPLNIWRSSALWDYIEAGFETLADGRVRLRCLPEIESEMLVAIGSAIGKNHVAEGLHDPFAVIERISFPVMLTTGALSQPQYRRMASGALRAIPNAELHDIPGCTHFLPMQLPEELVARVRAFATR